MNFKKIVYDNQEKIIKTFQELLRIPSVLDYDSATPNMPFGKNINDALSYMFFVSWENHYFDCFITIKAIKIMVFACKY